MIPLISFSFNNRSNNLPDGFIKNEGQIHDQKFKLNTSVQYLFPANESMNVHLRKDGFSYEIFKRNGKDKTVVYSQRLDFEFIGMNKDFKILEDDKNNLEIYIKNLKINSFRKITYQNVFNKIDIVFSINSKTKKFKYDFIVHPGGNVNDINISLKGMNSAKILKDKIEINHSLGNQTEVIPKSWIAEDNREVKINFKKINSKSSEIQFGFEGEKSNTETLIIDPEPILDWATYLGDTLKNSANGVTTSKNGAVYTCGTTESFFSLATVGSYQNQLNGLQFTDAYLMRFNSSGTCNWATYFGGNDYDTGVDIAVDTLRNVYLIGTTSSDSSLFFNGNIQNQLNGSTDVFIAKFKDNGTLVWSNYFGGIGEENAKKITSDFLGNVYITGMTQNSINELAINSNAQQNNNGQIDAFYCKIDTSGTLVWSNYLGGSLDDISTGISFGDTTLYFGGYTLSTDLTTTNGVHQENNAGNYDAFISRINPLNGQIIWNTFLGGEQDDKLMSIKAFNDVVAFTGSTLSLNGIEFDSINPTSFIGEDDIFIGRIENSTGQILWSDYTGGSHSDIGVDIDIELDKNIFFLATSYSDSLADSSNTHQSTNNGGAEVLLMKYDMYGTKLWSTYYGGYQNDFAKSVDVYGNSYVYIAGQTNSDSNIINPNQNSFQSTFSGESDGFLAKFLQNTTTMPSGFGGNGNDTIFVCEGDSIELFLYGGALGTDAVWAWYKDSCGGTGNGLGFGDTIKFLASTSFDVFVRAESVTNATSCFMGTIVVGQPSVAEINVLDSSVCVNEFFELTSNGISSDSITWTPPNGNHTYDNNYIKLNAQLVDSGMYILKLKNIYGCVSYDTVNINIHDLPNTSIFSQGLICPNTNSGQIQIQVTENSNFTFELNGQTQQNGVFTNLGAGNYTITTINDDNCIKIDSVKIDSLPSVIFDTIIVNNSCQLNSGSLNVLIDEYYSNSTVIWSNGAQTFQIENLISGDYQALVTTENGCQDSILLNIPFQSNLQFDSIYLKNETCFGAANGQISVIVSGGLLPYDYLCNNISTSSIIENLANGQYILQVKDINQCIITDTFEVQAGYILHLDGTLTNSDCSKSNGSIEINVIDGVNPVKFNWSNGDSSNVITNLNGGIYSVLITDSNNCQLDSAFTIENLNNLEINLTSDTTIVSGTNLQINSTVNNVNSISTIQWSPSTFLNCDDCQNPISTPETEMQYEVTYIDSTGCFGKDTIKIKLEDRCPVLFIPNNFSPNNDKINDTWCVYGGCFIKFEITLVNQWGEIIFNSHNPSTCWDGMFQGVLVPVGTYYYHLNGLDDENHVINQNGTVQINH